MRWSEGARGNAEERCRQFGRCGLFLQKAVGEAGLEKAQVMSHSARNCVVPSSDR